MEIFNVTKNTVVAKHAMAANTFISRLVGLLNKKNFRQDEALVIARCNCIHMFFMRFPIDAIFLDKRNIIVGVVKSLRPFQVSPIFGKANCVIEVPTGTVDTSKTDLGDEVQFKR